MITQEEKINDSLKGIKNLIIVVEELLRQSKQLADENSAICKRLDRIEQRLSDIDDIEERLGQLEDNQ